MDQSLASFADDDSFRWDNGEPKLSYKKKIPTSGPLAHQTLYDPILGNYCGYLKGANDFKVASTLCDHLPETLAVCKIPRGKLFDNKINNNTYISMEKLRSHP